MQTTRRCLIVFLISLAFSSTLSAQAQRTFVSAGSGSDGNPCTRQLPCRNFAAAIAVTADNGEVVVLDSGGYGTVAFDKSISLISPPGVYAGISALTPGSNAINIQGLVAGDVVLRGLSLTGLGGSNGINIVTDRSVFVENCVINGFADNGIRIDSFVFAHTFVIDSVIRNCGVSGIVAANGGLGRTVIDHCRLEENDGEGLLVSGGTNVMVRDSLAAGNGHGFRIETNNAVLDIEDSSAMSNVSTGFRAVGTGASSIGVFMNLERCRASRNGTGILAGDPMTANPSVVRVSHSTITNNGVGVNAVGAGSILSRVNNTLEQNAAGNTFPGTYAAK